MDGGQDTSAAFRSAAGGIASSPPPFLSKAFDMVDDPSTDPIVSWSDGNNSFVVWNVPEFSRDLLPKYFKHNNFSSFVRQLNTYGFRKVDPDRWEFANEGFLKGQKHLLKTINRRKPAHVNSHQQPPQVQGKSEASCVEIGKFGLEEEVERLKRDKNVLMQELVRLRQQQQATDHQLQTVGQRVQGMEQRQQQMKSFLAKAMQSPGFLAQMVQQQNESNRRISGVSKKRRLPSQDEESSSVCKHGTASPNGRMIEYQPLIKEAAQAMLRQIFKMNASPRLESGINCPNGLLIDDVPSRSHALDRGSSFRQVSGLTLSESIPSSSQSYLSSELGIPGSISSAAVSDIQSAPGVASDTIKVAQVPEMNMNVQERTVLPNFSQVQGIMPEITVEASGLHIEVSDAGNMGNEELMAGFNGGSMPIVTDEVSSDPEVDTVPDDIPKLPGINDIFWEQFLSVSPLMEDTEEIMSNALEGSFGKEQGPLTGQQSGWDKSQHMNHLTEQMGLLASEARRG